VTTRTRIIRRLVCLGVGVADDGQEGSQAGGDDRGGSNASLDKDASDKPRLPFDFHLKLPVVALSEPSGSMESACHSPLTIGSAELLRGGGSLGAGSGAALTIGSAEVLGRSRSSRPDSSAGDSPRAAEASALIFCDADSVGSHARSGTCGDDGALAPTASASQVGSPQSSVHGGDTREVSARASVNSLQPMTPAVVLAAAVTSASLPSSSESPAEHLHSLICRLEMLGTHLFNALSPASPAEPSEMCATSNHESPAVTERSTAFEGGATSDTDVRAAGGHPLSLTPSSGTHTPAGRHSRLAHISSPLRSLSPFWQISGVFPQAMPLHGTEASGAALALGEREGSDFAFWDTGAQHDGLPSRGRDDDTPYEPFSVSRSSVARTRTVSLADEHVVATPSMGTLGEDNAPEQRVADSPPTPPLTAE